MGFEEVLVEGLLDLISPQEEGKAAKDLVWAVEAVGSGRR